MEGNSIKIFQNLCKTFEMKIKLDRAKGEEISSEVLDNYEKYAIKIDNFFNEEFQKELKSLISPKSTLEEEKVRLEKLINLLEERLEKRSNLAGEYHEATGKYIKNLQLIVSESELNSKKERLELITKYLDTTNEIEEVTKEIEKFKEELTKEENRRDEFNDKNKEMEDELYSIFVTNINNSDYYRDIEEENLLNVLEEVTSKAKENKETLDITKESVESLLSSGISEEYKAYIDEANKNYTLWKDRELVLKIYKLVIDFKDNFEEILAKRNQINELLEERKNIGPSNLLNNFEKLMEEQGNLLNTEKELLDNIDNSISRITFKEERLEELGEAIKDPQMLVILSEYHINNDYDIPGALNETLPNKDEVVLKEHNPYGIVSIENYPPTLNVGLAKLKGASVRDKVNKKLNPDLNIPSDMPEIANANMPSVEVAPVNTVNPVGEVPSWQTANAVNSTMPEVNNVPPVDNQLNMGMPLPEVNSMPPVDNTPVVPSDNAVQNNSFWTPAEDQNGFPDINNKPNTTFDPGASNFSFPTMEGDN